MHMSSHCGAPEELLQQGREFFSAGAWDNAFESLSAADAQQPLGVDDLQQLAWAAGLTARDASMLSATERLYQAFIASNNHKAAARSAFWIGNKVAAMGEFARATAWFRRAQDLVDKLTEPCVEHGYLLLPAARRSFAEGDIAAAHTTLREALRIGKQFDEPDLVALAQGQCARALLHLGRVQEGLSTLDEVMLAVTRREISPVVAGLVYCAMIDCCHKIYAFDRAREWTAALTEWCDRQPQLVTFTGTCLVHRVELMEIGGEWSDALNEAQRASDRVARSRDPDAVIADAYYRQAEILRLRGQFEDAERAYGEASQLGREPQPGLALLRLAQGNPDAAINALRRILDSTREPLQRLRFLPAYIEALLQKGEGDLVERVCEEVDTTAAMTGTPVLRAMAQHARGMLLLAKGDAAGAFANLRPAFETWRDLGAPYIAARIRLLMGCACRSLGDSDGARLEIDAAREVFTRLGAEPDRLAAEQWARSSAPCPRYGLTDRELQVLRLVAAGKTNKTIATELHLSEKTIDRHVSNIFNKVNVNTRAAATAFAYEHQLF
jgi:ATP/maltotriose-dependent transcriptional regulator MalT